MVAESPPIKTMSETEILEIIKDSKGFHLLVNQFRRKPDVDEILALLNSDNVAIIEVGAYIAKEVLIDSGNAQSLMSRLRQLVSHQNPSVRSHALAALFPYHDWSNPATRQMLDELSRDPDEGVRLRARAALERMPKL
jgi:HEAT repeat protein